MARPRTWLILASAAIGCLVATMAFAWPPLGTQVNHDFNSRKDNPLIASDGLGGAYVGWQDFRIISGEIIAHP